MMNEGEGKLADKSESSSFEDLASAAANEIEEAKRADAAAQEALTPTEKKDEWQDLLGSGSILKKILKEGDESEGRPQRNDICRISYEIKLRDGGKEIVEKRNQVKIYMGDNEVLQGLDLALTLMHKGEECILQLAPRFAYGDAGLKKGESLGIAGDSEGLTYQGPTITSETWLEAHLELHDWDEEPDHETLSIAERMEIGCRRRNRGNWWYGRGEAVLAVQLYRRALDALDEAEGGISIPTVDGTLTPADEALHELLDERLRVYNNMAAAQLRAGAYDAALQAVTRVLSCQPKNAKALYRKSRILSAMGRNSEALEAAKLAAKAAPEDAATKRELQRCELRARSDQSQERNLAKRMLGAAASSPDSDKKKPPTSKMLMWGSIILSLLVGVASVLVYRYRAQQ